MVTSVAESPMSSVRRLLDRVFPRYVYELSSEGIRCLQHSQSSWKLKDAPVETESFLEQRVLLIPGDIGFFQLRDFPSDSISRQQLGEAVELDLARWVPWQEGYEFFFWPKKSGERWRVAVWVWLISDREALERQLPKPPTHRLPAQAWKIASLMRNGEPLILIEHKDSAYSITSVSEDFSTFVTATIRSESDYRRFERSVRQASAAVVRDFGVGDLPEWISFEHIGEPHYEKTDWSVMQAARLSGTQDWFDPFSWARPIAVVIGLYVFWLIGSGLVYTKHAYELDAHTKRAGQVSTEVLDARNKVETVAERVDALMKMRGQQDRFVAVLASISVMLPKNTWLEYVEYRGSDGGWLELTGTSAQSAVLAALLEQLPEVEHAEFVNAIRRDPVSGLEPFKIRLKLREVRK